MGNFLTWNFWFASRPGVYQSTAIKALLGFILVLIILALASGIIKQRRAKGLYTPFWSALFRLFATNSLIGLLLLFFNYELVPFLSARFWYLLWALGLLIWLYFIYKIVAKIPGKREQLEQEREFKKYIP